MSTDSSITSHSSSLPNPPAAPAGVAPSAGSTVPSPATESTAAAAPAPADMTPSRWDRLPRWRGRCLTYRYSARRQGIGVVNAIVEGYDDLARVRTEDPHAGILSVLVPEDSVADFCALIGSLPSYLEVKELPPK